MKRNLITLMLSTTILLTACGGNEAQNVENSVSTETISTTETANIQETIETSSLETMIQNEIDNIANQYEPQKTTDSLGSVCEQLAALGLLNGDATEMAGDMVGAISGIKYADSKVEIYEYDITSAKYKEIVETGKTTIEGFGIEFTMTAVNGPYALYCEEAANKDQIVEEFAKLVIE